MVEQQSDSAGAPSGSVQEDVELIEPDGAIELEEEPPAISEPAKVMRIGSMIRTLLEEVRGAELDEASRDRMREIYEQSVAELSEALAPELKEELERLEEKSKKILEKEQRTRQQMKTMGGLQPE